MENETGTSLPEVRDGKRRRFTLEQKKTLLREAELPGQSISEVGRRYGIAPSMLFGWRKAMKEGGDAGLKKGERVVPESELIQAQKRIRELERALGRKTMDNEILHEAVRIGREKNLISPAAYAKAMEKLKQNGGA